MADGVKISELQDNGTLVQATDYLSIVQPAQSPKNRKIKAQDLLAPARAYTDVETAARVDAVSAEASARNAAISNLIKTVPIQASSAGATANGIGGAGYLIASASSMGIAKLGSAWAIKIDIRISAGSYTGGNPMEWDFTYNSPDAVDPVFAEFITAMTGKPAQTFGVATWADASGVVVSDMMTVVLATAGSSTILKFIPFTGRLWPNATTASQLGLIASGIIIL